MRRIVLAVEERAADGGGAGKVSERRNMPVSIAFLLPLFLSISILLQVVS